MVEGIDEDPQTVDPLGLPSDSGIVLKEQVGALPHLLVGTEAVLEEDTISGIDELTDGLVTERIGSIPIEVGCSSGVRIFLEGISSHS